MKRFQIECTPLTSDSLERITCACYCIICYHWLVFSLKLKITFCLYFLIPIPLEMAVYDSESPIICFNKKANLTVVVVWLFGNNRNLTTLQTLCPKRRNVLTSIVFFIELYCNRKWQCILNNVKRKVIQVWLTHVSTLK